MMYSLPNFSCRKPPSRVIVAPMRQTCCVLSTWVSCETGGNQRGSERARGELWRDGCSAISLGFPGESGPVRKTSASCSTADCLQRLFRLVGFGFPCYRPPCHQGPSFLFSELIVHHIFSSQPRRRFHCQGCDVSLVIRCLLWQASPPQ